MRSAVLRLVQWWAGPLLLVALAFDAADRRIPFGMWTTGPVDEVAHMSTAAPGLLGLARFIDAPRRFYVAALIASVAIDVDHIPLYLGLLGNEAQRPVMHSLREGLPFRAFSPCALPPHGRCLTRPAKMQLSRQMPKAREGDPRNHRADACEPVQVTSNHMANLG